MTDDRKKELAECRTNIENKYRQLYADEAEAFERGDITLVIRCIADKTALVSDLTGLAIELIRE